MSSTTIADLALLSDCHTAALVTRGGSLDWFCPGRFDGPALFARLLDDNAGHFLIAPADDGWTARWTYRPDTLVLETVWSSAAGELVVTDALALGARERGHDIGLAAPGVVLRHVRCTRGTVPVRIEFVPRPEYGLVRPRLSSRFGGVVADGGGTTVLLSTEIGFVLSDDGATARPVLHAGEQRSFAVEVADAFDPAPEPWSARQIRRRLDATAAGWRSWSELHQAYEGPLRALVRRSGVVLQGLTHARTGAVVAAATTSLPEGVGSSRTWDYRFTWVRDASMTLQGLWVAACPDEAKRFFAFLTRAAMAPPGRDLELRPVIAPGGEHDLSERELAHLAGWRGSAPVRVGNAAWRQTQLDVYGAVVDAAYTLRDQLGNLEPTTRSFLTAAVDTAAERWTEDDHGLWEDRGEPRPFVYSKLMCWVAMDRGVRLAERGLVDADRVGQWSAVRDEIAAAIVDQGWSERAGAYAQSFGSDALDASLLRIAGLGFLPPDDPRVLATIDAIAAGLGDGRGLVRRNRDDADEDPPEGSFLLCTFWLAEALAVTGQVERAREVLDRAAGYATDLGLLAEEVDPATGELLGNFPQAFSHLGLVNAAQALAEAEEQSR